MASQFKHGLHGLDGFAIFWWCSLFLWLRRNMVVYTFPLASQAWTWVSLFSWLRKTPMGYISDWLTTIIWVSLFMWLRKIWMGYISFLASQFKYGFLILGGFATLFWVTCSWWLRTKVSDFIFCMASQINCGLHLFHD